MATDPGLLSSGVENPISLDCNCLSKIYFQGQSWTAANFQHNYPWYLLASSLRRTLPFWISSRNRLLDRSWCEWKRMACSWIEFSLLIQNRFAWIFSRRLSEMHHAFLGQFFHKTFEDWDNELIRCQVSRIEQYFDHPYSCSKLVLLWFLLDSLHHSLHCVYKN